jgi:hypothetical protein
MKSTTMLLLAGALVMVAAPAQARRGDGFRAGLLGSFGFGGEGESEFAGFKSASDNEATAGFVLFGEYPIMQYFAAGFEFGFLTFETEAMDAANQDRNKVLDFAPVLKPRFQYMGGAGEVFLKVPVGLSIVTPNDDVGSETGIGWTAGVLVGTSYFVYSGLALDLEMGWQGHGGTADLKGGGEVDYSTHQFQLRLGAMWEF